MSDGVERRGNGRFAKGQSGNPEGARNRKRKELINSEDIARTILRVAGSRMQMMIAGKMQDVSILEANVWVLHPASRPTVWRRRTWSSWRRTQAFTWTGLRAKRSSGSGAVERPGCWWPLCTRLLARPGRGRPAGASPVALHAALRASVLMVANAPTVVRSAAGRRRTVPLFQPLLLRLATGQTSRRSSPTAFLRLVMECAAAEPAPEEPVPAANPALIAARERLDAVMLTGSDASVDEAVSAYMAVLRRA